jgi:hypothetical protein
MRARKKAPPLGVFISVCHPASEVPPPWHPKASVVTDDGRTLPMADYIEEFEADKDGHTYSYDVQVMRGRQILSIEFVRGMAPGAAAEILRKLAAMIEKNPKLISTKQGVCGQIINGELEESFPGLELYDDFGNFVESPEPFPDAPKDQSEQKDGDV